MHFFWGHTSCYQLYHEIQDTAPVIQSMSCSKALKKKNFPTTQICPLDKYIHWTVTLLVTSTPPVAQDPNSAVSSLIASKPYLPTFICFSVRLKKKIGTVIWDQTERHCLSSHICCIFSTKYKAITYYLHHMSKSSSYRKSLHEQSKKCRHQVLGSFSRLCALSLSNSFLPL